ncbi:MAG: thiamine pyrophosphate-dependent enzyme [Acidobacteriota bacterium]
MTQENLLEDYRIGWRSRETSLTGWKEVFSGKAKFGIFGDGKELPQLAMARAFRPGDLRSGYYRDQTFMLAAGVLTVEQFFAQLYAHADLEADPATAGRCMNSHFATRFLDPQGHWLDLTAGPQSSADVSPTASQMPRLVGLAQASKFYRHLPDLQQGFERFTRQGNEVAWGTIGNASCAEGMFFESINAAAVLQVPMVVSIWDDGYGISVPNRYQIAKEDLTSLLSGFQRQLAESDANAARRGIELRTVDGSDYEALVQAYAEIGELARREHVPAVIHVVNLTQPQGHSTSGTHKRYKSPERLEFEETGDGLVHLRQLILDRGLATAEELETLESEETQGVRAARDRAWSAYTDSISDDARTFLDLARDLASATPAVAEPVDQITRSVEGNTAPLRRDLASATHRLLVATRNDDSPARQQLAQWSRDLEATGRRRYGSHLHSESDLSPLNLEAVPPVYADNPKRVNGSEVLNACFREAFQRHPELVAFGEDVGKLGDVNKGLEGLQEAFWIEALEGLTDGDAVQRITDTGIREVTIMGQAIGLALRGMRPVAEIQYLDYLLYGLQILSDDLATLQYRTRGGQKAPAIIRTRGHRLEGIWHSGSPMGATLNLLRGVHVCVPRNMTQAAGLYNTLLAGDDPGLVVEVLNGYRTKEALPENIGEMRVPLGVPEILREGSDITVVTYGACCKVVLDAAKRLADEGVSLEVVDVQTLLPFDRHHRIVESLQKTGRILFVDEDVPGGASAFMKQRVLEEQNGYYWLDEQPLTLTAEDHRPPYGSDGDYWAKPNIESVFDAAWELMHRSQPGRFSAIR